MNPGPLHWELGVLATGSPGMSWGLSVWSVQFMKIRGVSIDLGNVETRVSSNLPKCFRSIRSSLFPFQFYWLFTEPPSYVTLHFGVHWMFFSSTLRRTDFTTWITGLATESLIGLFLQPRSVCRLIFFNSVVGDEVGFSGKVLLGRREGASYNGAMSI